MDPLTLALLGGGSMLASMFLNSGAQNSVNNARSGIINAERGRQAGFDAETGKLNDQSLGRYSDFGTKQTADAAHLAEMFKTPVVTPNTQYTAAPLPTTGSDLTSREVANKNGIAQAYVNHQGDTLANLRSFGDLMGHIGLGQARDAQLVGQVGGFKKGSSNVEQLELDNANRAGNTEKLWADIAAGLGKVGLTAGLSGQFAPAAAAGSATSSLPAWASTSFAPAAASSLPAWATPAAFTPPPANIFSAGASPFLNYGRA